MKEHWDARIEIYKGREMTKEQRKDVALWLREKSKEFLKEADNYATHFKASLIFQRD